MTCSLLKNTAEGLTRHTGRDEVEIRYPVKYCFFWIPDSRFAPSGMTDMMLALKILSFSVAYSQRFFGNYRWEKAGVSSTQGALGDARYNLSLIDRAG